MAACNDRQNSAARKKFLESRNAEDEALDSETLDVIINASLLHHGIQDLDQTNQKTLDRLTVLHGLLSNELLEQYMETVMDSSAIQEYLAKHPEDMEGLDAQLAQSYALEHCMNFNPPDEYLDWDTEVNLPLSLPLFVQGLTEYFPSVIFNPVATIYQTYKELKNNFLLYHVIIYVEFPVCVPQGVEISDFDERNTHLFPSTCISAHPAASPS
ncbi:hypothetical protein B0I35DRAFT_483902 [Stachybotrys elegans]|uniref:Uncharacterized protein n=1 Tax=Stachybotrys elegans TaxID=80388 RepID=A0A8K0WLJ6_9HYPO|nr:hypothetical protein B0I35DRAFT_483902 [Stachybotrys elegans]